MELPLGPPRNVPHRARTINVQVEHMLDGTMRISTPHARGWAAVARTPMELARGLAQAFVETSVAAYARGRGEAYDLDVLTSHVPGDALANLPPQRVRSKSPQRRKAHSPADWQKVTMEDRSGAMWRSPGGRMYGAETAAVRSVVRKRAAMGLPT
jgi:hypothetical protein